MTPQEARQLIIAEGQPRDGTFEGLWLDARSGVVPTRERMYRLLFALRVQFDSLTGLKALDRELCAALWTLGCFVPQAYRSATKNDRPERPGFDDELFELEGRVSNVFVGTWQEWVSLPELEDESSTG